MTDQKIISVFALGDIPDGDAPTSWVQVMIAGDFDHARYGKFKIADSDLAAFASDIKARADQILIDFDHDSADGRTRAAGWFTGKTKIEPDGQGREALFAEVEWTPSGAAAVRSKEYRFISPEFADKFRDMSGKIVKAHRMFAAALTNRPFLKDMAAVTLADADGDDDGDMKTDDDGDQYRDFSQDERDQMAKSGQALPDGSFPIASVADLRNAVSAYGRAKNQAAAKAHIVKRARALGRTDLLPDGWSSTQTASPAEEAAMELKDIAKGLGLAEDADSDAILAALKAKDDEIAALKAKTVDEDTLTKLAESAAKGEQAAKELHDMKRESLLDEAVRERKILPAQRESFVALYDVDPEKVVKLLADTPARSLAPIGSDQTGSGDARVDARPVEIDGARYDVNVDSVRLDAKAREILKEQGKTSFTEDEYLGAVRLASDELGIDHFARQ